MQFALALLLAAFAALPGAHAVCCIAAGGGGCGAAPGHGNALYTFPGAVPAGSNALAMYGSAEDAAALVPDVGCCCMTGEASNCRQECGF
jgi:hypothetical protein